MAHNLEIRKGRASIAYAGETPWHKLGTKLNEAFTAAVALDQAGLNFTVEKTPIACADSRAIIPGQFAVRRTDTSDVLGVVGNYYQPLQNSDAFSFFDSVFGKDKARFECAGVLGKGENVWMLAKLPGEFRIHGEDVIGKYLLLTNNHSGKETVRARFTPIRVVCQNTLNAAMAQKGNQINVYHMGDPRAKLALAGKLLKDAGVYFDEAQDTFRRMAEVKLTDDQRYGYFTQTITNDTVPYVELSKPTRETVDKVQDLAQSGAGAGLPKVRGTLWGAYNAVTEWVDHVQTDKVDSGLAYMAAGRGARIKARAFETAEEIMAGLLNRPFVPTAQTTDTDFARLLDKPL